MARQRNSDALRKKGKRRYGDVNTKDIVAAALKITKRTGITGLSMRNLAKELNLSTMAAYYYVPNKEALIDLVVDEIFKTITVSDVERSPEKKLRELFWRSYNAIRQYPGLSIHVILEPNPERKELSRVREEIATLFREAGYNRRYLNAGMLTFGLFHAGALLLESTLDEKAKDIIFEQIQDGLSIIFAGMSSIDKMNGLNSKDSNKNREKRKDNRTLKNPLPG